MSAEIEVLKDAVGRLDRVGIPYMLTGSMALAYYAEPRMTRDIDLVVELDRAAGERIVDAFAPDYYVSPEDAVRAVRDQGMFNALHLGHVVKVDFMVRKDDPYRRHEFERRCRVSMPGFEAWIVSREDLILSKLVWAKESASEMQLRDVRALLAAGADADYLRRWAVVLGVENLLEDAGLG